MPSVTIRLAEASDAATIVRLVRELADFEGLLDQVRLSEADVLRDGFGEQRRFACLLAEVDGAPVGLALYFEDYSTFEGRPGFLSRTCTLPRRRAGSASASSSWRVSRRS
jgi:hypothetical protein